MSAILGNGSVTFGDSSVQSTSLAYATKLMNITDGNNTAYRHCFAIMNDGRVKGWGYNQTYTLGMGNTGSNIKLPQDVGFPSNFPGAAEVYSASNLSAACIDVNGQLWMWGRNDYGSCGIGSTANVKSPVNVSLITNNSIYGKTVTQVAYPCGVEGIDFVLVLCSDGTVHACGYNGYGQCGNGNTTNQSYFVRCGTLTNVTHIASGRERYTTCAAVSNGFCYVWGYNGDYNLGNGNTSSNVYSPQLRNNGSLSGKTVSKVGAGRLTMYALCTDGTFHGWGNQNDAQFGLGGTGAYSTPVQINTNVASFQSAGYDYAINTIIKTDGTVYYAGYTGYLLGNSTFHHDPIYDTYGNIAGYNDYWTTTVTNGWYKIVNTVGTPQKVIHAGTGSYNTIWVLMTDGTIWAAGYNGVGQLGIGDDRGYIRNGIEGSDTTYSGPLQVKCDLAADIICYGHAQYTNLVILTRKGQVKVAGNQADWAHGVGTDYHIYVPTALTFN